MTEPRKTVTKCTCKECGSIFERAPKNSYLCKPCKSKWTSAHYRRLEAEGRRKKDNPEVVKAYLARPEVKKRKAEEAKRRAAPGSPERFKHESRWITRRAISSGILTRKPCEVCGDIKVDAHHDDYSKPLDVRWLCRLHHSEHHRIEARHRAKQEGGT